MDPFRISRRRAIETLACSGAFFTTAGLYAEELARTATIGEGPFYPDKMPRDTDNDLLILNDSVTPAVGEITHLSGRVLTTNGSPVRNAFVEIWQVDNNAAYIHTQSANSGNSDKNFQGYGRYLTDSTGHYYFRTIKPVPYPGRTPHIHFAISRNGRRILTTQMLIKGHPKNEGDGLFRSVRDPAARQSVLAEFKPLADSKIGELTAHFDLVLGRTAFETEDGKLRGGIAPSAIQSRRRG
jgi:protocatechuate 3,4-dioxygenase beta subunit